jgi:hypothetical protein
VAVVSIERGDQGGHFDTSYNVAVAVLAELWRFEKCEKKRYNFWRKNENVKIMNSGGVTGGSGRVAVVSIERGDQGGSNGSNLVVAVAVLAEI